MNGWRGGGGSGASLKATGRLERDTRAYIPAAELKGMEWMKFQSLTPQTHALHTSAARCSNIQLRRSGIASSAGTPVSDTVLP